MTTGGVNVGRDRRGYVGPREEYDVMGATQLALLYALGLREHHRLLDIGCGSLRAGRLLIQYLAPGGYTAIEPNIWLVDEAVDRELGRGFVALKEPVFLHNSTFDVSGLDSFDFVLAYSIASHTGPQMTRELLMAIRRALAPQGLALITFVHGPFDWSKEGWVYPGLVHYRRSTTRRWVREAGLRGTKLRWYNPRQTWWVLARGELPPGKLLRRATGSTAAFPESVTPILRARRFVERGARFVWGEWAAIRNR